MKSFQNFREEMEQELEALEESKVVNEELVNFLETALGNYKKQKKSKMSKKSKKSRKTRKSRRRRH